MSDSTITRRIPLHRSLLRPQLILGGERGLVMLNLITAAALIFGLGGKFGIIGGVVLFAVVHYALVAMAKRDDQAFDVYRTHIHLQKYYPAGESEGTPNADVKNKL